MLFIKIEFTYRNNLFQVKGHQYSQLTAPACMCEAKLIVLCLYASPPHLLQIHVVCVKKDYPTANHPRVKGRPVQSPLYQCKCLTLEL